MDGRIQLLGLFTALTCASCDEIWRYVGVEARPADIGLDTAMPSDLRPDDAQPSPADLTAETRTVDATLTDSSLADQAPPDLPPPVLDGPMVDCLGNDGEACSELGKPGICHKGACCTGCWDYSIGACHAGDEATRCGQSGDACSTCPGSTSTPCMLPSCGAGQCDKVAAPDQMSCTATNKTPGRCFFGVCYGCTGCWSGDKCVPGYDSAACGVGGLDCVDCGGKTCWAGVCEK